MSDNRRRWLFNAYVWLVGSALIFWGGPVLRNPILNLATRYRIVGVEVEGLGAFLLFIMFLQLIESNWSSSVEQFAWVYAIIGATGILVGLEILSLNKYQTAN